MRKILKNKFTNYEDGLKFLNIDDLDERRRKHSLNFAKKCLRNEKVRNMFPVNIKNTRYHEKYKVNFAKTMRYKKSTIPSLKCYMNMKRKLTN